MANDHKDRKDQDPENKTRRKVDIRDEIKKTEIEVISDVELIDKKIFELKFVLNKEFNGLIHEEVF